MKDVKVVLKHSGNVNTASDTPTFKEIEREFLTKTVFPSFDQFEQASLVGEMPNGDGDDAIFTPSKAADSKYFDSVLFGQDLGEKNGLATFVVPATELYHPEKARFALLVSYNHKHDAYHPIGGKVDKGDTSYSTLRREWSEEVGSEFPSYLGVSSKHYAVSETDHAGCRIWFEEFIMLDLPVGGELSEEFEPWFNEVGTTPFREKDFLEPALLIVEVIPRGCGMSMRDWEIAYADLELVSGLKLSKAMVRFLVLNNFELVTANWKKRVMGAGLDRAVTVNLPCDVATSRFSFALNNYSIHDEVNHDIVGGGLAHYQLNKSLGLKN